MKKKSLLTILICAFVVLCCMTAASCASKDAVDKAVAQGYTLIVKFDTNGGIIGGDEKVSLMDLYRPADYEADENGDVHIKVVDPIDGKRPNIGYNEQTNKYPLTKAGNILVGWYATRVEKEDGTYEYSDKWDFSTNTVTCKKENSERKEITLYAVWTEFFEFDFYTVENGEETLVQTYSLGVIPSEVAGTENAEKAGIYLPRRENGRTVYKTAFTLASGSFEFPQPEGKTFKAAYTDKEKTHEISTSAGVPFVHSGSIDEHGVSQNRVQKIYVDYDDGVIYDITTADQLIEYADVNSYSEYRIAADLDFNGKSWPAAFIGGAFKGKIYSVNGGNYKFTNVKASVSVSDGSAGLFSEISDGALIENITFSGVVVDFASGDVGEGSENGLFAGKISDKAVLRNVKLENAELRIGFIENIAETQDYEFDIIACGNKSGIIAEASDVKVVVHCDATAYEYSKEILYGVDPEKVTISENGKITFKFLAAYEDQTAYSQTEYEI